MFDQQLQNLPIQRIPKIRYHRCVPIAFNHSSLSRAEIKPSATNAQPIALLVHPLDNHAHHALMVTTSTYLFHSIINREIVVASQSAKQIALPMTRTRDAHFATTASTWRTISAINVSMFGERYYNFHYMKNVCRDNQNGPTSGNSTSTGTSPVPSVASNSTVSGSETGSGSGSSSYILLTTISIALHFVQWDILYYHEAIINQFIKGS
jgi:hypothetical protein